MRNSVSENNTSEISDKVSNPPVKILIVDDREENLTSIEVIFERKEYKFVRANSGQQALKVLLKEYDFTIILMDVEMPGLNGFETASLIYEREKLRHIPIVFITANSYSQEYIFQAYQTGAVDYISKPINPELLRAKVSVFVDLYKKNHQLKEQEQKLLHINNELEDVVKDRTESLILKNDQLESMNYHLKKVNNDLDNFVYSASHDLKAPLSNIEALLNTLVESLQKHCSEEDKMVIEMMNQSLGRFKETIQDLSKVIRADEQIHELDDLIDCGDIIEDVKVSISENIKLSNAEIRIEIDQCQKIKFSKKNLKSIIYNLLSNAIKYRSPDRKPEILIRTHKENDFIILTVKDNGLGMDLNGEEKLFSLFKRLHSHVEGTGVGLYLVKRIINNAGGKIEVESEVGKGSEFKVYFKNSD